jgi:hypothetical protein
MRGRVTWQSPFGGENLFLQLAAQPSRYRLRRAPSGLLACEALVSSWGKISAFHGASKIPCR